MPRLRPAAAPPLALGLLALGLLAASPPARGDDLETEVTRMARVGSCGSPSFSPDGSRLAFVSDLSGVPQVWTVDSGGGWPRQVTALDDQVGGVVWSPGGGSLAFSLAPGGGMNQQIYLVSPDGTGLKRLTDGGEENNWLGGWSHDGRFLTLASNRRRPAAMDAWAYDLAGGGLRLVAENPGIGQIVDLSRDGGRATLFRMRSRGSTDLVAVELATGAEHLLTPHEGPGNFSGGLFSPDGATVYLGSDRDRDRVAFARVRLGEDGSPDAIEVLAARDDADLDELALSEDGATAALLWNAAGRSEMTFVDLASGEVLPGPDLPGEIAGGLTFSHDGKLLAFTVSGAARPRDVWVLERATGRLRQVTESPHAGVDLEALVRPELVRFPAADGLELSGWLYRPPGVAGPAPFVLSFHGGPEGQARPGFRGDFQALLGRGIGVFDPNVRGSAGFGKRFVNLDNGELRFDGIRDIAAAVAYLVDSGIADPERIGIMGGSYGGYMTMAGLSFYPQLFAAGADLFGVVNFETFFAHTEPWMAAISTVEYGDPKTQADLLRRLSPIHRLDAIRAPTLVLHGANDTNVPVVEAEQVVENLQRRGVPVKYVLFPDEGHGFRKTANRITSTVTLVRWFAEHLAGS
jgi:dipeptidyl aminopeptidase/acylaminoacyl peptidase